MKHTFIISDESVNSYGFRVLTDGIDHSQYDRNPIVLYMHIRGKVIGRAEKVYKKDGQLLADVEFDMEDEEAAKIAGKVERGFLRMTSVWIEYVEVSYDDDLKLKGQEGGTITKSKLKEISVVDLGSNDEALKLFDASGNEIKLADFSKLSHSKNSNKMSDFKNIAKALNIDENASEGAVLSAIGDLNSSVKANTKKLAEIEAKQKEAEKATAVKLTDRAIELEIIPASFKENQIKLFDGDFKGQEVLLNAEITKKEGSSNASENDGEAGSKLSDEVKDFLGSVGKTTTTASGEVEDFEYLTKNNPVKLADIEKNKPKLFAKLLDEYVAKTAQ